MLDIVEDLWEDGLESLTAGIIAGYKMCCNTTELDPRYLTMNYTVVDEINKSFTFPGAALSLNSFPVLSIKKDKWICLSGISLICQAVKKMAGLGDNISGAGFVHHSMKHHNK